MAHRGGGCRARSGIPSLSEIQDFSLRGAGEESSGIGGRFRVQNREQLHPKSKRPKIVGSDTAIYMGGAKHRHLYGALGGTRTPNLLIRRTRLGLPRRLWALYSLWALQNEPRLLHTVYRVYGVLSILHRNCTRSAPKLHREGSLTKTRKRGTERRLPCSHASLEGVLLST